MMTTHEMFFFTDGNKEQNFVRSQNIGLFWKKCFSVKKKQPPFLLIKYWNKKIKNKLNKKLHHTDTDRIILLYPRRSRRSSKSPHRRRNWPGRTCSCRAQCACSRRRPSASPTSSSGSRRPPCSPPPASHGWRSPHCRRPHRRRRRGCTAETTWGCRWSRRQSARCGRPPPAWRSRRGRAECPRRWSGRRPGPDCSRIGVAATKTTTNGREMGTENTIKIRLSLVGFLGISWRAAK